MHPVAYRVGLLAGVATSVLVPYAAKADIVYSTPIVSPAQKISDIPDTITVTLPSYNLAANHGLQPTGIVLTVSGSGTGIFRVTNNDPTTSYSFTNGGASGSVAVTYVADTGLQIIDTIRMSGISGKATVATNSSTPSTTYFTGQPISGSLTYVVPVSKFAEFESTNSSIPLQFTTTVSNLIAQGQASGRNANAHLNYGATASITATISIDYQLPEPATLSVLGGSLVGLGMVRRRKRA